MLFIISKWKGDKRSVEVICLGPSKKTLLSAGQSIKVWDIETKKAIQVSRSLFWLAMSVDFRYFWKGKYQ